MTNSISKRVSNYELFFDLAFVLAISKLTLSIHINHIHFQEIFLFIITNVILLNLWMVEVFYYNKYGDSRRIDIFTITALMFVVGNLALTFDMNTGNFYAGNPTVRLFNALLMLSYAIVGIQYFLKGRVLGFSKDILANTVMCFIYSLFFFPFVAGWLGPNIYSAVIYLFPNILPLFTNRFLDYQRINFPHIVERLQLITILCFGEMVIAIISSYPLTTSLYQGALLFLGMSYMFVFYIMQTFLAIDHHHKARGRLLFYAHNLIFIGVNLFTVGIEFLSEAHHARLGYYLFLIGFLGFYIGTITTTYYNQSIYKLRGHIYLKWSILIGIGAFAMSFIRENIFFLSVVLAIIAKLNNSYYLWIRRKQREQQHIPHPNPHQNIRDFS